MSLKTFTTGLGILLGLCFTAAQAEDCQKELRPAISFIKFQSQDYTPVILQTGLPKDITVQGKLSLPVHFDFKSRCFVPNNNMTAVVILHGSAGIDARGEFYAQALNAFGIATLEIDMWDARGVHSLAQRPPLPLATYPDAFNALEFLANDPHINANRVGVLGFSWGGIITMASATQGIVAGFGKGHVFKAHVANYPICYVYNSPLPNSAFGALKGNPLTGAPIMVQIGTMDDYDLSAGPCFYLKNSLVPSEQALMTVVPYEGAVHEWDRLMVPITNYDPFGALGAGGNIRAIPDVDQAYESRQRIVRFFLKNL